MAAPTIAFVGGGGGSSAAATAIMNGDAVGWIQLTNAGSGYTEPLEVTFSGGGGTGAAGRVVFTAAIDGAVYAKHGTTTETRLTVIESSTTKAKVRRSR